MVSNCYVQEAIIEGYIDIQQHPTDLKIKGSNVPKLEENHISLLVLEILDASHKLRWVQINSIQINYKSRDCWWAELFSSKIHIFCFLWWATFPHKPTNRSPSMYIWQSLIHCGPTTINTQQSDSSTYKLVYYMFVQLSMNFFQHRHNSPLCLQLCLHNLI
mgnify:CR=1 FL=1